MKKKLLNVLCWFVPSARWRHKIRKLAKCAKPQNNIIEIVKTNGQRIRVKRVRGCTFKFSGDNNHIVLYEPLGKLTLDVNVTSSVYIELGASAGNQRKISVHKRGGVDIVNRLIVGDGLWTTNFMSVEFCNGVSDILIGKECLFAAGIVFRTGDYHTILDVNTGAVLNHNKNICIGNHVWIADACMLLKGAAVADNTIIGARSLVNKPFEQTNVIIAGVPARVVKENVNWDRRPPYQYATDNGLI